MSDRIPFHIQEEIMIRLPVKSLIQFRSVSKAWKSLIGSSEFIAAHCLFSATDQPHHLLVSCKFPPVDEDYVLFSKCCYIDDDNSPQQMYVPTLPLSVKQIPFTIVIGSSRGLLCLYGSHPNSTTGMAVVWNPSIGKSIVVDDVPRDPYYSGGLGKSPSGFGVCPVTNDPKIVVVTHFSSKVMVYTLNSGKWRNLPNQQIGRLYRSVVVTDRFIYWRAESETHKMITSFDLTSESFEVIDLPYSLAHHGHGVVEISKLKESVALLQYGEDDNCSTVWIMEHGDQRSFTKLFTIKTPHESIIVGFRQNGMPIMQVTDDDDDDDEHLGKLVVYEPNSEHDNVLEICPTGRCFFVDSYMETLILLGRSDCSSY